MPLLIFNLIGSGKSPPYPLEIAPNINNYITLCSFAYRHRDYSRNTRRITSYPQGMGYGVIPIFLFHFFVVLLG